MKPATLTTSFKIKALAGILALVALASIKAPSMASAGTGQSMNPITESWNRMSAILHNADTMVNGR